MAKHLLQCLGYQHMMCYGNARGQSDHVCTVALQCLMILAIQWIYSTGIRWISPTHVSEACFSWWLGAPTMVHRTIGAGGTRIAEEAQLHLISRRPAAKSSFGICAWLPGLRLLMEICSVSWLSYINLVDPASSHMLVSKIKPCMSQYKLLYGETANGSLKQL